MNLKKELKYLITFLLLFTFFYVFPAPERILQGIKEGTLLLRLYIREHFLFCLVPAFFVAGAISTFLSKESIIRLLGPSSPKALAYLVASVSGTIIAVCSCTVLPLFAGLYLQGVGLGPAITFLYSGPAINILAMILTAKVLGLNIGLARTIGSITMSILLGILMHLFFKGSEPQRKIPSLETKGASEMSLGIKKSICLLLTLVGILIIGTSKFSFKEPLLFLFYALLLIELYIFLGLSVNKVFLALSIVTLSALLFPSIEIPFVFGVFMVSYYSNSSRGLLKEWFDQSYLLARQIFPWLFLGVFMAGFLLGGVEGEGYIPKRVIEELLGGNSFFTYLLASILTALMYFATLTEVPIIQGLLAQGIDAGLAITMLLAGPALSLPSLLVLKAIIGPKKTLVYASLVVFLSALYGFLYQIMVKI
ncbi:MAG: permease [Caldimicrobium sp.]|nr:permease [Caldimicrobium sp.]MCX7613203.1 permease [Caldimicrobium sp.]MDW8182495.1 permease [Caldimicrobium sp.]